MERIRDALEKARKQREKCAGIGTPPEQVGHNRDARQVADLSAIQSPTVCLDQGHLERNRIVAYIGNSEDRAPFDLLRIKLLHIMAENGWRSVGIVSPTAGAGKSVLAINLAMSIARLPDRTSLLVDLDLRDPSILRYLGVSQQQSMSEFLQGKCGFEEVLIYPQIPRFVVAGTSKVVSNSTEILASQSTGIFIGELTSRYQDRIVILDLPPLLATDDAIAVLPKIDCTLLVIGDGMSSQEEIEETLRQLPAGSNLVGTVLNKALMDSDFPHYGYGASQPELP